MMQALRMLAVAAMVLPQGLFVRADDERGPLVTALAGSASGIVHESYRENNWELILRAADGSNPRNLTGTPSVHELYPQASRDGKLIAFVGDETIEGKRVRSVFYMNRDGSGRKLVARNARQPCWSPDNRTLAYLPGEFDKYSVVDYVTRGLRFYDTSTGKHRDHPNKKLHHLYNITWSPGGRWILSTVHGGMGYGHAILAIAVDGDVVHDLKISGCRPDFSPDGKRICWGMSDHVIAVGKFDLGSGSPRITGVSKVISDKKLHLYHSDLSPDGRHISFSLGAGGRVGTNGPGTSRGLAEFVGVRAKWDLCVVEVASPGRWERLTGDGLSNKESEWLPPVKPGKR